MARSKSASSGLLEGFPLWARVISVIGFPAAAASVLLWSMLTYGPAIVTSLQEMKTDAAVSHLAFAKHMEEESRKADQQTALLQQLCLLNSKTDADRLRCVAIVGGQ